MKEYARKFLKFLFFFLDFTCGTLLLSAIANSERCKETKKKKKKLWDMSTQVSSMHHQKRKCQSSPQLS